MHVVALPGMQGDSTTGSPYEVRRVSADDQTCTCFSFSIHRGKPVWVTDEAILSLPGIDE
ncbi:hypothetical protein GCM10027040_09730 [Halomonas shantousis]